MFLLDTNVISELRRPDKADRNVVAWANALPASSFFISAISVLEIELGALLIAPKDSAQGAVLRAWIDHQLLGRFEGRILAIDVTVAQRCAHLHVPNPRAERDALIAATALVHGLTVVTRNVTDFEAAGVALINPWRPQHAGKDFP
jgi:toxin FitB